MDRFFKKKYVKGSAERKLQKMLTAHLFWNRITEVQFPKKVFC